MMTRRRSFLAAILAAAAAPTFVRKLESALWLPAPVDTWKTSWCEIRAVATAELFTADGEIMSQRFVYTPGALEMPEMVFAIQNVATVLGMRVIAGSDSRVLPFTSGPKHAISGDSIHVATSLVRPLGEVI